MSIQNTYIDDICRIELRFDVSECGNGNVRGTRNAMSQAAVALVIACPFQCLAGLIARWRRPQAKLKKWVSSGRVGVFARDNSRKVISVP
jgi:hypothetical protein